MRGFIDELRSIRERDPAAGGLIGLFFLTPSVHVMLAYRLGHRLWRWRFKFLARFTMQLARWFTGIEIHPAAKIGQGLMIDHAHSIVIGETAVVGDNVSMLHSVTLGGTGKVFTDRHPKIGNGVLLGAGCKILGNITIGDEARVGSGSVVLSDVPPRCSVAGVPAKPVGGACMKPAQTMDQKFDMGL